MDSQPTNQSVPVVTTLDDIYANINNSIKEKHEPRYNNIRKRFNELYGKAPEFYCRAPGRVNVIGEHIDYCGYSVLPAALEQDLIMAFVRVTEGEGSEEITINNIEKDLYPSFTISTDPYQKLKEEPGPVNYFLCGYKAILAHDESIKSLVTKPCGLKILMDSTVPPAAGLSSSSAFTVCSAVTAAQANGVLDKIAPQKLADLTISAERMAGTACGGMDQTISIMGKMGTAMKIDFIPQIACTDVKIPESCALVIGNSCTPSPKLLTLGTRYNKRVCECRFALAAMTMKAGLSDTFLDCPFKTFQQLQDKMDYTFDQMIELAKKSFQSHGEYTPQKISREFGVEDPWKLVLDVPHWNEVQKRNASFELYKRAFHVFSEAKRVHQFADLCADTNVPEEEKVVQLGKWMTESQLSCAMYYDCSSPQLDELTKLAREAGALGSRLTGAGWGGCTVSLVQKEKLNEFIDKVYPYYTKQREPGEELWITDDLDRYIFATLPSPGACVIDPQFNPLWHM